MNSPFADHAGHTYLHRIDPRLRLITACTFILLIALINQLSVILTAATFAIILLCTANPPLFALARRFIIFNCLILMIVIIMPLSMPGPILWQLGPLHYSQSGLRNAALIAARANTILLIITALLSTIPTMTLGHTLHHLKLPDKLVSLLLFNIRYLDIIRDEYHRMTRAAKCRGFQPRTNIHTIRTYAYIITMLFIRAYQRAQRILNAMKCRGFHGRFHLIEHFHWHNHDYTFATIATTAFLILLIILSWT